MATAIYTKEAIWAAADELEAAGEKPTHAIIRKKLGGGSFTTISEAMNERRSKRDAEKAPRIEPAPERVSSAATEFAGIVWASAQEVVNTRLAAERDALETARNEFAVEQQEAADFADQLSADLEIATAKIDTLTVSLQKTEIARDDALSHAQRSEATAAERQTHIVSIKDDLHHQQQEHGAEIKRMSDQVNDLNARLTATTAARDELTTKLATAIAKLDAQTNRATELAATLKTVQDTLDRRTTERDEQRSRSDRAEATAEAVMKQHSVLIATIGTNTTKTANGKTTEPSAKAKPSRKSPSPRAPVKK